MIELQLKEGFIDMVSEDKLHMAALAVLAQQGKSPDTIMTIVISDDEKLQHLNQQFLGIDQTTDVLSFPSGDIDPDTGGKYLGDILISFPQAQRQADAAGHSLSDELQLLVVHGCLHLLGFDHDNEDNKKIMWAAQNEILNLLGVNFELMD